MRTPWLWVACCCAVMAACGGSTPTGPSAGSSLSRTRFLAFGDSLTAGEITAPVASGEAVHGPMIVVPAASYPAQLLSILQARYPAQAAAFSMSNAGKLGEFVQDGADRFPGTLAASQAEVVLLMEGLNGLLQVGPDFSSEFMRDMVRTATAQGVRVFVASMMPTIAGRSRSASSLALVTYNGKLQQMAAEERVVYVDLYNALLPEALSVIGADGLHPTEVGYRRMAEVFFNAIQANLEVR